MPSLTGLSGRVFFKSRIPGSTGLDQPSDEHGLVWSGKLSHSILYFQLTHSCVLKFFGGTVGLGIAEPVFASELSKFLLKYAPDAPAAILKESPTAIYTDIPADQIPNVVRAYAESLKIVFLVGVPVGE